MTQKPLERWTRYAEAQLPTERGETRLYAYRTETLADPQASHAGVVEHTALVVGDVARAGSVLARVHSECFTGEVLGSLKCDCGAQLQSALDRIAEEGSGVLVYLKQEGRGIGLGNKIRAYALQEAGLDTVDANLKLGFSEDGRDYRAAADILKDLGVQSVRLMTNSPDKQRQLEAQGIVVSERLPLIAEGNPHNAGYLETKRLRFGHTFR